MRSESAGHHEKQIFKQLKKSNYYDILDLKQGANDAQIKRSFKQMALKYHPDKNSASYSKEVFHKISEAYDTLSDPTKRNIYDQKQAFMNMPKQDFDFRESTTFFYQTNSFYSGYGNKFRWQNNNFQKRKSAEFKFQQKARQERQKFKKQHNQKNKNSYTGYKNPFYKGQKDKSEANSQKYRQQEKEKQKQNSQQSPKKHSYTFKFQKNPFKKFPEARSEYEQVRNEMQRKFRLEKQREKAQKNIRMFMLFVFVVALWIAFDYYGPTMRGIPVYSMSPSEAHTIPKVTSELRSPFYATQEYEQRASADLGFKQYLDRKIDLAYIKTLSRVCNIMRKRQDTLYNTLDTVKSKKSKNAIESELQSLDLSACSKLHHVRQMNPIYFKGLFNDPNNNKIDL